VEITADERHAGLLEHGRTGGISDEGGNVVTPAAERFDEMSPDEAGRAGDERLHTGRSYRR
jgi:hypothetical protein